MATRHERVVLDLEDRFSGPMARAAAATTLLDRSLKGLDGSAVRTSRDMDPLGQPNGPIGKTSTQSVIASREIDRTSGRLRLLADTALVLGPALVPIGAVGIPAIAGLASSFGAAALAGGVALASFQGVGTALEAVNKAALEPSAENLEAARLAMERLGPEAQALVTQLRELMPTLTGVRNAGAAGMFPGLTASLEELTKLAPQVERIAFSIGRSLGDLAEQGAEALTGDQWSSFLRFIETDVPPVVEALGRTVGNLASGLAQLWMAFDPVSDDFVVWMLRASDAFDSWATGLSQTQGFQDFVNYLRQSGPQVGEALAAIGNALLAIVEAAAPLGGPVLQGLTAVANVIAAIAGSDAGPAIMATVTALTLLNRGMRAFEAVSSTAWVQTVTGANKAATAMEVMAARRSALLRGGAALAGLAIAATDLGDGFQFANTASGALMGAVAGPWGAAIGGAAGLMLDLAGGASDASAEMQELTATLNQQTGAITQATREKAAGQLFDKGALDAARSLGLSLPDVTSGYLGNADAVAKVTAELESMRKGMFDSEGRIAVSGEELQSFREKYQLLVSLMGGAGPELSKAQAKILAVGDAAGGTAGDFNQAQSAAQSFADSIERVNRTLSRRASFRDYQQALDDFTKGLKENGRNLNINTQKGRDNQAMLDGIAATANKVAENLKGTNRVQFLRQARQDFVDAATKAGMAEGKARDLSRELIAVGRQNPKPTITVQDNASSVIEGMKRNLAALDGDTAHTYIYTHRIETKEVKRGLYADGGYVTGPGGPRDDRIPAMLSNGEFVVNAAATRRNLELLESLNAQRFADGGRVQSQSVNVRVDAGAFSGTLSGDGFMASVRGEMRAVAQREIRDHERHQWVIDRD